MTAEIVPYDIAQRRAWVAYVDALQKSEVSGHPEDIKEAVERLADFHALFVPADRRGISKAMTRLIHG